VWTVCNNQTLHAGVTYIYSASFTNPGAEQAAQTISIAASGTATIVAGAFGADHSPLLGVTNGTDPLRVVVPKFNLKQMVQSMPVASSSNALTLSLQSNVNLVSSVNTNASISITNLTGADIPDNPILLVAPQNLSWMFCNAKGEQGRGSFTNLTSILTIFICPNQSMQALTTFSVTIYVVNGAQAQRSPPISIYAAGDMGVIISSTAGHTAYENGGSYVAAKHAETSLARTLRLELNGEPIRVTEIAPGMVKTEEFSLVRLGDPAKAENVYKGVAAPLVAEDVAEAIRWSVMLPDHFNVDSMIIRPIAQAANHKVHRTQ